MCCLAIRRILAPTSIKVVYEKELRTASILWFSTHLLQFAYYVRHIYTCRVLLKFNTIKKCILLNIPDLHVCIVILHSHMHILANYSMTVYVMKLVLLLVVHVLDY